MTAPDEPAAPAEPGNPAEQVPAADVPQAEPAPHVRRAGYVVAGVVLLVVGVVSAVTAYPRPTAPAAVVAQYFAALQAGDAPRALSLAQPPAGNAQFLVSKVLRVQRALGPISVVSLDTVQRAHGAAHVRARYQVGAAGGVVTDDVVLHQQHRRWLLDRAAATYTFTVSPARDRALLAGAAVPDGPVALFPGVIPVRFDDPLLAAAAAARSTLTPRTPALAVRAVISRAGRNSLVHSLTTALNRCLTLGSAAPKDCPLTPPGTEVVVPRSLRGRVAALRVTAATVSGPAGLITAIGRATVEGRYQVLDFQNVAHTRTRIPVLMFSASFYARAGTVVKWSVR